MLAERSVAIHERRLARRKQRVHALFERADLNVEDRAFVRRVHAFELAQRKRIDYNVARRCHGSHATRSTPKGSARGEESGEEGDGRHF